MLKKRLISFFMAVCMVVTLFGVNNTAMASGADAVLEKYFD